MLMLKQFSLLEISFCENLLNGKQRYEIEPMC